MDKKTIILVIILFIAVVVGMFIFAYLKKAEVDKPVVVEEEVVVPYAEIDRIDAKHFFQDGTHTFVGEIVLPTPCDLIEVTSSVAELYPEQVRLDFIVINNSASCAEILTTQRFSVTAAASEEAQISATFMGREVKLNLIPAAAGETPDEFELYIKG